MKVSGPLSFWPFHRDDNHDVKKIADKDSRKQLKPASKARDVHGFDQERLDRLSNSMQPLLTRNATTEELDALLKAADDYVDGKKGAAAAVKQAKRRIFGRFMAKSK
ncbi:hypothetical protein B0T24DRAFT_676320 [Lasiosphaeria ovina]|uniref:Uncharacterized protein n=1 Tax=Lasiosphaeria ovina TaxID=92902 RepID=A0AAE0TUY2_9PEZI|nr:hypothetical protein B0T24DRAFT_676320 [Lasiosphaeria ovina]